MGYMRGRDGESDFTSRLHTPRTPGRQTVYCLSLDYFLLQHLLFRPPEYGVVAALHGN